MSSYVCNILCDFYELYIEQPQKSTSKLHLSDNLWVNPFLIVKVNVIK